MTSQAIIVPPSFQQGALSTVFQGQQAADDMAGGITGGYGLIKYRGKVWSIQYQGNNLQLMRDDGDGPRGSIDVILLKANPNLSKTWYEAGFQEGNDAPPDCASANGVFPDAGVPKRQANVCAQCPRNQFNTAPNGGKGKACSDHRRMAAVPLTDPRNETFGGALLLRCPAASLQDLMAFDARYKAMGYPYFAIAIKISFDPTESFPKFTFQAIRPLTDDEAAIVVEMRNSPEVARVISENSTPAPAAPQVAAPQQQAFLQAPPPNAVQPVIQPAPAPVAAPAVQPQQPQQTATGFGPVATATTAQQPQTMAQQPVQRAMTGFGPTSAPVTPAGNGAAAPQPQVPAVTPGLQQVAQETAPPPPPAAPATAAFDQSIDDRLASLLAAGNAGAAAG